MARFHPLEFERLSGGEQRRRLRRKVGARRGRHEPPRGRGRRGGGRGARGARLRLLRVPAVARLGGRRAALLRLGWQITGSGALLWLLGLLGGWWLAGRAIQPIAAIAAMLASSPAWLGAELERSWRSQWPDLPAALDEAASYHSLGESALRAVGVPVGIASAVDDPVHPASVAQAWAASLPRGAVATTTLDMIGRDPAVLGSTCIKALAAIESDTTASA